MSEATKKKPANRRPPGDPDKGKPVAELERTRLSKEKRRVFLNHLAATCNVKQAAAAAGSGASYFYGLRRTDAEFGAGWEAAVQAGYDRLEEALLARALEQVGDQPFDPGAVTLELVDDAGDPARTLGPVQAPTTDAMTAPMTDLPPGFAGVIARVDVRLALAMLARRAAAERKGREPHRRRRPTAAEVETTLNAKLDALARRVTPLGGEAG